MHLPCAVVHLPCAVACQAVTHERKYFNVNQLGANPPTTHTCSMSKRWVFFQHKSKAVFLTKQARYLLSILPECGLPGYGKLLHETQHTALIVTV